MNSEKTRWHSLYFLIFVNVSLVVILILVLGFVATLRGKVEDATAQQRQACGRGNLIRGQVNYNSSILQSFLAQAAMTREETAEQAEKTGDKVTARINRDAADAYRHLGTGFVPLPIINCESVYP